MLNNYLVSVKIKGFKSSHRVASIEFSGENSTTIYGENGCGKTTFLKILGAVFSKNEKVLKEEKVDEVQMKYCVNGEHKDAKIKRKKKKKEDNDGDYSWKGTEDLPSRYIYITTDRGLNCFRREISELDILQFFKNKGEGYSLSIKSSVQEFSEFVNQINQFSNKYDIQNILYDNKVYIENITMEAIEELFGYYYGNYERNVLKVQNEMLGKALAIFSKRENTGKNLDNDKIEHNITGLVNEIEVYREKIIKILSVGKEEDKPLYHLFESSCERLYLPHEIPKILGEETVLFLSSVLEIYKENMHMLDVHDDIKKCFEEFISDNKQLIIEHEGVHIKIGEETHDLNQLSNGERHLLTFLTILGFIGRNKDIIMIDEPGISMDTDWQEKLVSKIQQLCPNQQIIMTTHSPDISLDNPKVITRMEVTGE